MQKLEKGRYNEEHLFSLSLRIINPDFLVVIGIPGLVEFIDKMNKKESFVRSARKINIRGINFLSKQKY